MRYHTKVQTTGILKAIVTSCLDMSRKSETTMPIISRERQTLRTRRNRTVTANIRALASSGMLNVLGQYAKTSIRNVQKPMLKVAASICFPISESRRNITMLRTMATTVISPQAISIIVLSFVRHTLKLILLLFIVSIFMFFYQTDFIHCATSAITSSEKVSSICPYSSGNPVWQC